ncbi:hypothetical protein [Poseidonibacter ostreae]|nr:hypothetical protein [Poseidonibacter ostreae]
MELVIVFIVVFFVLAFILSFLISLNSSDDDLYLWLVWLLFFDDD